MYSTYEESLVPCPYNRFHQVSRIRLQKHLIKCQDQHPNVKLVSCLYNFSHKVKPEDLLSHYEICPNKVRLEGNHYLIALDQFLLSCETEDDRLSLLQTINFDNISIGTTSQSMELELKDVTEFEEYIMNRNKKLLSQKCADFNPEDVKGTLPFDLSDKEFADGFEKLCLTEDYDRDPKCLHDPPVKSDTKKNNKLDGVFKDGSQKKSTKLQSENVKNEHKVLQTEDAHEENEVFQSSEFLEKNKVFQIYKFLRKNKAFQSSEFLEDNKALQMSEFLGKNKAFQSSEFLEENKSLQMSEFLGKNKAFQSSEFLEENKTFQSSEFLEETTGLQIFDDYYNDKKLKLCLTEDYDKDLKCLNDPPVKSEPKKNNKLEDVFEDGSQKKSTKLQSENVKNENEVLQSEDAHEENEVFQSSEFLEENKAFQSSEFLEENKAFQSPEVLEKNKAFQSPEFLEETTGLQIFDDYYRNDESDVADNESFAEYGTKSDLNDSVSLMSETTSIKSDCIDENGFVLVKTVQNSKLKELCKPIQKKGKNKKSKKVF